MTRVLAFDQASRCGWAGWDGHSAQPALGTHIVQLWGIEDGAMLERFRLWLGKMLLEHDPQVIAVEDSAMGGHSDAPTIARQAMLRGMIAWAAHHKQVPLYAVHPSTWRKTFIGFGSRGKRAREDCNWKQLSLQRARSLGWSPSDHNAADAAGILDHLTFRELGLLTPWRRQSDSFLPLPETPHAA